MRKRAGNPDRYTSLGLGDRLHYEPFISIPYGLGQQWALLTNSGISARPLVYVSQHSRILPHAHIVEAVLSLEQADHYPPLGGRVTLSHCLGACSLPRISAPFFVQLAQERPTAPPGFLRTGPTY